MKRLPFLSILTTALTLATAQAAGPVTYASVAIAPETQEIDITAWLDSGFPEGQILSQISMNCSTDGKPVVTGYKQNSLGDWQADDTKSAAARKVTAVKLATESIITPNLAGDLRFFCKDKKLVTDFSKFTNPNAAFIAQNSGNAFDIRQNSVLPLVHFEYPLASSRSGMDGNILPQTVRIELLGRGFKKVSGIQSVNFSGSAPKSAVFVHDAKKNVLVPAYYNGRSETSKLKGMVVGERLDLYYAPDYSVKTGWRKLTIDLKNSLIWTEDVSMPSIRIAN